MIISARVNGEIIDIEVEELSTIQQARQAAIAPDSLIDADPDNPDNIQVGPELIDFMEDITKQQTDLDEEYLNALDVNNCMNLMSRIVSAAFGTEPKPVNKPDDYRINSDEIDFNNDGSVDLEDWR